MKSYIFSILFATLPFLLTAQMKSSVDLILGGDYSFRHLKPAGVNPDIEEYLLNSRSLDRGKVNWRAGLNYNRRITDRFYFKTGLRMASVGFKQTIIEQIIELGTDSTGALTINMQSNHIVYAFVDYWFMEIPILGRMEFGKNKLTAFIETGIAPSFYVTTRRNTIYSDKAKYYNQVKSLYAYNRLHITGVFSLGLNYNLNPKYQLFFQPTLRYLFTPLSNRLALKEHLYNFGIELGVRRKIN